MRMVLVVFMLALFAFSPARLTFAQTSDPRTFPETGYTIADDAVWTFFSEHGGVSTFGPPISREFTLLGTTAPLPMGVYLEEVLTGQNLPADLASESATSALRGQQGPEAFVPIASERQPTD